jgi:DNA-damage-inducible protein D
MPLLGYLQWKNFYEVVLRAQKACFKSGQNQNDHFADISKMVPVGSNTVRKIEDFKLDRYACYLIAQNGDSGKPQIALAQTYFAIQTRRQEIIEKLSDNEKRLFQ